jgi:DnaJ domain
VDHYAVLGLPPGASPQEVAAAYRKLAKRLHPDVAPGPEAARRMAEVNVAYAALRGAPVSPPPRPAPADPPPVRRRVAGWWLDATTRRKLPGELVSALEELESVHLVTPAWTRSSPETVLAVTDRRLLWLLDDKVLRRVRSLPFTRIRGIDHRLARPRRRAAILQVRTDAGRHSFRGLPPAVARGIEDYVTTRARAG